MAQTNDFSIDANLQGLEFRNQANEKLLALATLNAGNTPPINPQNGMVWLDTSKLEYLLKIRRGSKWVLMCSVSSLDTQEITSPNSLKLGGTPAGDYRKVADSYSKAQIDEKLKEARKALVENFINKSTFSAYENLPHGDMSTKEYWQKIPSGLYWLNADSGSYTNNPARYAHFLVLKAPGSQDLQVICFRLGEEGPLVFKSNSARVLQNWESLNKNIGEGQRWQDVTGQRQPDVNYTNTTGRPIMVMYAFGSADGSYTGVEVDGVLIRRCATTHQNNEHTITVIVPNGSTYKFGAGNYWANSRIYELR